MRIKWEPRKEKDQEKTSEVGAKHPESSAPGAPMPPIGPPPVGKPSPPKDKTPNVGAPLAAKKETATKKKKNEVARSRSNQQKLLE
jgi:hypothetical protein